MTNGSNKRFGHLRGRARSGVAHVDDDRVILGRCPEADLAPRSGRLERVECEIKDRSTQARLVGDDVQRIQAALMTRRTLAC